MSVCVLFIYFNRNTYARVYIYIYIYIYILYTHPYIHCIQIIYIYIIYIYMYSMYLYTHVCVHARTYRDRERKGKKLVPGVTQHSCLEACLCSCPYWTVCSLALRTACFSKPWKRHKVTGPQSLYHLMYQPNSQICKQHQKPRLKVPQLQDIESEWSNTMQARQGPQDDLLLFVSELLPRVQHNQELL